MIFNVNESVINENVAPSPYEVGLEGALMHVYENECNYNALMEAAGLSELKYFQETGNDLFLNEAGAFSGFLEKAKEFFKKVIEKIKAMFKKFFMAIGQFVMSDKSFVKKYEKDLLRVDTTDLEFNGYKFKDDMDVNVKPVEDIANCIESFKDENSAVQIAHNTKTMLDGVTDIEDNDQINDYLEKQRGTMAGGSPMTEAEFREEIKEKIYGDSKETLENISLREQMSIIRESSKTIKAAEKDNKKITDAIDKLIKALDRKIKEFGKVTDEEKPDTRVAKERSNQKTYAITALNALIRVAKSGSNDATIAYGILLQGLKDRNRQAKAICVKAINYKPKNESASYSEGGLFADVVIR